MVQYLLFSIEEERLQHERAEYREGQLGGKESTTNTGHEIPCASEYPHLNIWDLANQSVLDSAQEGMGQAATPRFGERRPSIAESRHSVHL